MANSAASMSAFPKDPASLTNCLACHQEFGEYEKAFLPEKKLKLKLKLNLKVKVKVKGKPFFCLCAIASLPWNNSQAQESYTKPTIAEPVQMKIADA